MFKQLRFDIIELNKILDYSRGYQWAANELFSGVEPLDVEMQNFHPFDYTLVNKGADAALSDFKRQKLFQA